MEKPNIVISREEWKQGRARKRGLLRQYGLDKPCRRSSSSSDKRLHAAFDGERGPDFAPDSGTGFCFMCDAKSGDIDPFSPNKVLRLMPVEEANGISVRDKSDKICNACKEGLEHALSNGAIPPRPDFIALKTFVNRATVQNQRLTYEWLRGKFENAVGEATG